MPEPDVAGVELVPFLEEHVDQVVAIEGESFTSPWSRQQFFYEIRQNRWAVNRVAVIGDRVAGYICAWVLFGELKINNIAVHPELRRRGLARAMLVAMLDQAREKSCRSALLEVRESNEAARRLYREHGFVDIDRRRGYYQQDREDAIIMHATL